MERSELRATGTILPVYSDNFDLTPQAFAELVHDAWYYTPLQTKTGFGQVQGDLWAVGDWLFSNVHLPPALYQTERCHILEGSTHFNLERLIHGQERGRFSDDRNLLLKPGEISFCDEDLPYQSHVSERRVHSVTVPRNLLGLPEEGAVTAPNIQAGTPIGRIIFAEWDAIYHALERGAQTMEQSALERLAACIKISMGTHPQREDVRVHARDALFRQICRYIEAHLEDASLSTNTLLDQFGVSRATLYRMFEPLGGVRNYVTERRAASALFFISKSDGRRGLVQAACERWGFSSAANFNRTIQRLFGNSPKALLFARDAGVGAALSLTEIARDCVAVRYQVDGDAVPIAA